MIKSDAEEMEAAERRLKIFEMIQQKKSVRVSDLTAVFQVSAMTIRRDLAGLESQGLVTLKYGGAVLREGVTNEPSFSIRSDYQKDDKRQIGFTAAQMVRDGDSIFLDCGSTPLEMIRFLQKKKITIITNSWRIPEAIKDYSNIKLILAPGTFDPLSAGVQSSETIDFIRNYVADKAFISTLGVDIDSGTTVASNEDAQVKMAIMASAKTKILLADHSKFGKVYMAVHGALSDYDMILTDAGIAPSTLRELKQHCFKVMVCCKLK